MIAKTIQHIILIYYNFILYKFIIIFLLSNENTNPSQCPGLIVSSSTARLLCASALVPLCRVFEVFKPDHDKTVTWCG